MRYFLPMVQPTAPKGDDRYDYDVHLDLDKMPVGLTPGEYAFCIVRNMQKFRSVVQYSQKTDVRPQLAWSALIGHAKSYGAVNRWTESSPETVVEAILDKGASLDDGYWKMDLVEWPLTSDRCFLAWCDKVIDTQMQRRTKSKEQREQPETDGSICTQLGRWLAQRPDLLELAPNVIGRLVQYVETVDSMADYAFNTFLAKHHSGQVMHCEGLRGRHLRSVNTAPIFQRSLSQILKTSRSVDWSDQALRSFAIGFAWELRAQGNTTIFDKITQSLNRTHLWISPAQLELCMKDDAWVRTGMEHAAEKAQFPLVDLAKKDKNYGLDMFYPFKLNWYKQREQGHGVAQRAMTNPAWAQAVYKLTLASSLREHFSMSYGNVQQSFECLQAATPLLAAMDHETRNALFEEMTQSVEAIARISNQTNYKTQDPWGLYADAYFDAWTTQNHEDAIEGKNALSMFVDWLSAWRHPYQEDVKMLAVIAGDCASVGTWLAETVAKAQATRNGAHNPQDDSQILLHELLDLPMEAEVTTKSQNNPQSTGRSTKESAASVGQEKILPKQDFANIHPSENWDVGSLF